MIISESDYKEKVLALAEKYFYVDREVTGYLFGNRCRIDAIIKPKQWDVWANKHVAFGVEFKHFSEKYNGVGAESGSLNYYSKQFKQIIDYSYTDFNNYGKIPILISPPLFNNMTGNFERRQAQLIKNCMAQCNVGEIFICNRKGLSIIFNTFHLIWCERFGISLGKTQLFLPKTGSGSKIKQNGD